VADVGDQLSLRSESFRAACDWPMLGAMAPEAPNLPPALHSQAMQLAALPTISHELRLLVDGAQRCLHEARRALARGEADDEAALRLETATRALERMALLAQAAAQGRATAVETCSIVEAIHHTAAAMLPLAREAGVELVVECSPRLILTQAGPIYAVVANTLRNAIEAALPGGTVLLVAELVTAGEGGSFVEIDVLDDGQGLTIAPEQALAPGVTTKTGASGIGLALSAQIVRELGGVLEIGPRADGQRGAHVRVRYPASSVAGAAA